LRWSSVSESERASADSADDRTRNCGSETRGATLAGEAVSCLLYIIHLNGLRPWGRNVLRPPTSRSLSCPDLRLSGSTPGSYYLALRLGWVAISWPLCAIMGSGRESIIDNYERRSPAWPSFVASEGLTFYDVPATDPDGCGVTVAVVLNGGDDEGYT
jgi:hypothetical protein